MIDLLIAGGTLADGTGAAPRRADVAVTGGRVARIGDLAGCPAARTMDASGHVVAPGFVDVHTHSDLTLLSAPEARSAVRQGITTVVVGNCGLGVTPAAATTGKRCAPPPLPRPGSGRPLGLDRYAWLPGGARRRAPRRERGRARRAHAAARRRRRFRRPPGRRRRARPHAGSARRRARGGRRRRLHGAGLRTGLLRPRGRTGGARPHGRRARPLFAWHVRDYADGLLDSVRQALRVAAATGCRTQISHLVAVGRRNHGSVARALELIDAARAAGLDVGFDIYPYLAGNAPLSQLLPAWAQEGGERAMRARLTDRAVRARVRDGWRDMPNSWDDIVVGGRAVTALAADAGTDPPDLALDLVAEHGNAVQMVAGGRSERDLADALAHPAGVIGSDGQALDPAGPTGRGTPHPAPTAASRGCSPSTSGRAARARRGGPQVHVRAAERAGLAGRGVLKPGAHADIVVFDPARIVDRATFAAPQRYPDGIRAVIVGGRAVVEDGAHGDARPGEILRVP
ncbi:amidohydrolase family protein [Actinomadura luteofluorescens]|uniref:N-acyl-D-amino-acid deacylase family protein n=1 Tax=Actinomadura luteofluorescens TaxID=46163 RepID=UPI00363694FA